MIKMEIEKFFETICKTKTHEDVALALIMHKKLTTEELLEILNRAGKTNAKQIQEPLEHYQEIGFIQKNAEKYELVEGFLLNTQIDWDLKIEEYKKTHKQFR